MTTINERENPEESSKCNNSQGDSENEFQDPRESRGSGSNSNSNSEGDNKTTVDEQESPSSYSASVSSSDSQDSNSLSDSEADRQLDKSSGQTRRRRFENISSHAANSSDDTDFERSKRKKHENSKSVTSSDEEGEDHDSERNSEYGESSYMDDDEDDDEFDANQSLSLSQLGRIAVGTSSNNEDSSPFMSRILDDCSVRFPEAVATAVQLLISRIEKAEIAILALRSTPTFALKSYCLTNAMKPSNSFMYVSRSFLQITGYQSSQVLGQPLLLLQGADSDAQQVEDIKTAFLIGEDIKFFIKFHRADNSSFSCFFQMSPLKDHTGKVVLYLVIIQPDSYNSCTSSTAITNSSTSQLGFSQVSRIETPNPHHHQHHQLKPHQAPLQHIPQGTHLEQNQFYYPKHVETASDATSNINPLTVLNS